MRTLYLEKRRALPNSEWEVLNTGLLTQLRQMDWPSASTAHIFLPIRKFGEPDTYRIVPVVNEAIGRPLRWAISRTDPKTGDLYHFVLDRNTPVRENNWGIPEPLGGYRVEEQEMDLVFVPLLAFDQLGHRVGYGKGYYDRFLGKCRPDALKM